MDIVLLGSGNLATNLGFALRKAGVSVVQVFSNTEKNAADLAYKLNCDFTNDISKIKDADIYISALKDNACNDIWGKLKIADKLILHTSGSLALKTLSSHFKNTGVIYPLMTLSKGKVMPFDNIPILIEANSPENLETVFQLASKISGNVIEVSSEKRAQIHLAAVWANNFSNHMYAIAKVITDNNNLPFSLLFPLIEETANKIKKLDPADAQTGPAIRFDENIIEKQQNATPTEFKELYKLISESIHLLATKKQ